MKTKRHIIATLIAMVFTTTAIQAQSARRPASQERDKKTEVTRSHTSDARKKTAHTTKPARQVQARQVQSRQVQQQRTTQQRTTQQRKTQPARQVQTRQVQPQQAYRPRTTQKAHRPASISTSHNPKSTYRKPEAKVYVDHNRNRHYKENKYSKQRYYGGHHHQYAYPTKKVKFHYHHDTYANNYHVLYYPSYSNIYWTRNMYRNYRRWYPEYSWNYNYGHRIQTISVFDAKYNLGEVANIYGRVYATWYNEETNDYLLFFGGDFPYQQFTVVLPARIARKFSWRPERYFLGEHITITGLITTFDGSPEIVVRDKYQLGVY